MFRIPRIIRTIGHFPLRVVHLSEPARFWPAGTNRKRQTARVSLEASQARNPLYNRIRHVIPDPLKSSLTVLI